MPTFLSLKPTAGHLRWPTCAAIMSSDLRANHNVHQTVGHLEDSLCQNESFYLRFCLFICFHAQFVNTRQAFTQCQNMINEPVKEKYSILSFILEIQGFVQLRYMILIELGLMCVLFCHVRHFVKQQMYKLLIYTIIIYQYQIAILYTIISLHTICSIIVYYILSIAC